jgi:DNA mismatch repair protein MutS2
MNKHSLNVLGFPELLAQIADNAQSPSGQNLILGLKPQPQPAAICRRHGLYRDLIFLCRAEANLPGGILPDIEPILRRLEPLGSSVDGVDLNLCLDILEHSQTLQRFSRSEACLETQELQLLGEQLSPCEGLLSKLRAALDPDGLLLDTASPQLRKIRRRAQTIQQQIQDQLMRLLQNSTLKDILQEQFVTQRNGRYVIPVRREMKKRLSGIVHDHSDSGRTLFVEPSATVTLGNELATLNLEEKDECRRILASLSAGVRENASHIRTDLRLLAEYDAAKAVGTWSVACDCILPTFGTRLSLKQGRHPLLVRQFQREKRSHELVPLDLNLPPETKILTITGSNSGGKTVTLKTLGLITLAAQAGLPVPIGNNSVLEAFDQVFADIGDEQSLSENLSTFTGHLTQMNEILSGTTHGRCLVLLDELGSGTDPLEGGALACAILQELCQGNVLSLVTTHIGSVKTFVNQQPQMLNAAVRFNTRTLHPEYVLEIGHPGASHAFSIAQRLGLPANVLERAKKMLNQDHLRLESMLARLEDDQRLAASQEKKAQLILKDAIQDRDKLRGELQKLHKERRLLLHDTYQQAAQTVENTRKQMERLLASLNQASLSASLKSEVNQARQTLATKQEKLSQAIDQTAPRPTHPLKVNTLKLGKKVWIEKLRANGRIVDLSKDHRQVTVEVGHIRFNVKARELGLSDPGIEEEKPVLSVSRPKAATRTPSELNLIGCHVEEARERLEQYLNQVALANLSEVRVIHGFGTGTLQRSVHEFLQGHKLVKKIRLGIHGKDPGGSGATVVTMN